MTDAPERIWAHPETHPHYKGWDADGWCTPYRQEGGKWAAYRRADLPRPEDADRIKTLEARNAELVILLIEARCDLAVYVSNDYPTHLREKYERIENQWQRDMELCRQIDAALAKLEDRG